MYAVVKISGCEISSSWYYQYVGKKIRVHCDSNGNPVISFYYGYGYYTEYNNNGIINIEDTEHFKRK